MDSHDSILPLVVSLALALGVHLAALAGYAIVESGATDRAIEPSPPAPDLSPTDLAASEPRTTGEPVSITTTLRNAGDAPTESFEIELFLDDRSVARFTRHALLAPGASFDHTFVHTVDKAGAYRVRIVADPGEAIDESDETNNELEAVFVWTDAGSETSGVDLAVASLAVPKPRIAGEPATLIGKIANLGAATDGPAGVAALIDGELVARGTTPGPIPTGGVVDVELPFTIDEPGEHKVTLIADHARAFDDIDLTNNRRTIIVRFNEPAAEIEPGQLEDSPVDVNWISYEDHQELLAAKAKIDQAVTQTQVDPVENAPTPLDPTPLSPRPSPAPSQPQPERPEVAKRDPQAERSVLTPMPDDPTQPEKPLDPKPTDPTQAPALKDPTPDAKATAPTENLPVDPNKIAPTHKQDTTPDPVVDRTPNPDPAATVPETGKPDRVVDIKTPPIDAPPGPDPVLPEHTDKTDPVDDKTMRTAPDAPEHPKAKPSDESSKVEAEREERLVAALPLPPDPDAKPASPETEKSPDTKPDRETARPDKPVDEKKPAADGSDPSPKTEPSEAIDPSPARPEASPTESRPTSAPKTEREAPPVTRIENVTVRPGEVVARKGLRINTVVPRYSAIARRTAAPGNPIALVSFDRTGKVVNVRLLRSTGYDNIDGPLVTAMYKWSAEGPLLKHVAKTWDVTFNIDMGVE